MERLAEGPVIGDGGFVFAMEKRGYVKAGPWTPEVVMENPEAGTKLFVTIFTYYSNTLLVSATYFNSKQRVKNWKIFKNVSNSRNSRMKKGTRRE